MKAYIYLNEKPRWIGGKTRTDIERSSLGTDFVLQDEWQEGGAGTCKLVWAIKRARDYKQRVNFDRNRWSYARALVRAFVRRCL